VSATPEAAGTAVVQGQQHSVGGATCPEHEPLPRLGDFLRVFEPAPAQLARALWLPDGELVFTAREDQGVVRSCGAGVVFVPQVSLLAEEQAIFRAAEADQGAVQLRLDCPDHFLPHRVVQMLHERGIVLSADSGSTRGTCQV
jgi:hypothetical protein